MPILKPDYKDLNFEEMAVAIGLKPKHIPMLIGSFLEESLLIMDALSDAIEQNDFPNIRTNAHSIKGSAGNLKFNDIYAMAKEMEFAAADEDSSFEYKAYFEAIKSAIDTIPK